MNLKNFYWAIVIIFSLIPTVIFHLVMKEFWKDCGEACTSVTSFELMFTIAILPIYLLIINAYLIEKGSKNPFSFLINLGIICFSIYISAQMHFENWVSSVGSRGHVDTGTKMILNLEILVGTIVSVIGGIIIIFRLLLHNKKAKKVSTSSQSD
jgi:hypothetical protein